MPYDYGDKANEYLLPDDARQFGIKCRDCGGRKVVYHITVPPRVLPEAFPIGAYCLGCLAKRCIATQTVPVPMEDNLFDALKHDISARLGKNKVIVPMNSVPSL
ncbi:hypothetical protein ACFLYS_01775 [Chloroflexota bacterium]